MNIVKELEELKKARNRWLERMFFGGVIVILGIIANIPSLDTLATHLGVQISIIVCLFYLSMCLFKIIQYQKRIKEIQQNLFKSQTEER